MYQIQHNRRNYLNGRVKTVTMILLLAAAVFVSGFVWANSKIVIKVDGKEIVAGALSPDPKEILSVAGVLLGSRDEYRVVANEAGKPVLLKYIGRFR